MIHRVCYKIYICRMDCFMGNPIDARTDHRMQQKNEHKSTLASLANESNESRQCVRMTQLSEINVDIRKWLGLFRNRWAGRASCAIRCFDLEEYAWHYSILPRRRM